MDFSKLVNEWGRILQGEKPSKLTPSEGAEALAISGFPSGFFFAIGTGFFMKMDPVNILLYALLMLILFNFLSFPLGLVSDIFYFLLLSISTSKPLKVRAVSIPVNLVHSLFLVMASIFYAMGGYLVNLSQQASSIFTLCALAFLLPYYCYAMGKALSGFVSFRKGAILSSILPISAILISLGLRFQ